MFPIYSKCPSLPTEAWSRLLRAQTRCGTTGFSRQRVLLASADAVTGVGRSVCLWGCGERLSCEGERAEQKESRSGWQESWRQGVRRRGRKDGVLKLDANLQLPVRGRNTPLTRPVALASLQ